MKFQRDDRVVSIVHKDTAPSGTRGTIFGSYEMDPGQPRLVVVKIPKEGHPKSHILRVFLEEELDFDIEGGVIPV